MMEVLMSETVAIILSFRENETEQFEKLFSTEIYPLWEEFKAEGKIIAASLTPALDAPMMKTGVREYILLVELPSRTEHEKFDSDPRFLSFLGKVTAAQPERPKVWLGNTLFKI
jgi:hypothetical protein